MLWTPCGTSKSKVCVGPAPARELPPVSVPLKVPPVVPVGISARSDTGISAYLSVDSLAERTKRRAAALSPGDAGIENSAVTEALAPAARSKWAGDTEPSLTKFSVDQTNCTGPL